MRQGTMDEIARKDPDLHHQWEEMIETIVSESESESEEENKTVKERQQLMRSVSTKTEDERRSGMTPAGRVLFY